MRIQTENALSLADALAAAEPGPGGLRLAHTVPEGDYIAVQHGKRIDIRKSTRRGQAWLTPQQVGSRFGWEPL